MGDTENQQEQAEETQEIEKPEAEKPEGEEVPKADAEAKGEEGEGEAAGPGDGEEGEKPDAKAEGKHKRENGHQRTARRAARLEAEVQFLREQMAQMAQRPQAEGEKAKATPEQQAAEQLNALINQRVQQALAQRDQETASRQVEQKWQEQLEAAGEDEAHEVRAFLGNVRQSMAPGPLKEALLTSEYAPKIISSLLGNPLELARISALPEGRAAAEIGRLEAKLAAGAAPQKTKAAVRPPAPPTSVNGSASSTRSIDDLPISEYKRAYRSGRR